MANERKRVILTLSGISLSKLDKLIEDTGETYSEFVTRMIFEQAILNRKE